MSTESTNLTTEFVNLPTEFNDTEPNIFRIYRIALAGRNFRQEIADR